MSLQQTIKSLSFFILTALMLFWALKSMICGILIFFSAVALSTQIFPDKGYTSIVDVLMLGAGIKVNSPKESAVLITGTTSGLGKDMAMRFYAKGYTVFATCRKPVDYGKLEAYQEGKKIGRSSSGGQIFPVYLDTCIPEKVDTCIRDVKKLLEEHNLKLTGVICNAGVVAMCPMEADTISTFKWIFNTKVLGHMQLVHGLISTLRNSHGRIVLIGAPDVILPNAAFYGICNQAIQGLARALRIDLYEQNISVSEIKVAGTQGEMANETINVIMKGRAKMSEEMKQIYGLTKMLDMHKAGMKGYPVKWCFDSAYHAISSRYPKTKYSTTPAGTLLWFVSWLLPDRVLEMIMWKKLGCNPPEKSPETGDVKKDK